MSVDPKRRFSLPTSVTAMLVVAGLATTAAVVTYVLSSDPLRALEMFLLAVAATAPFCQRDSR